MIHNVINALPELNNKYPNINYGGCGTFSYHLHKALKEKYNINTEIVYIKADHPPGGKPDFDLKFTHILLRYENYYIDNNGIHFDLSNCEIENLPLSKLEEMIYIPELWNNKFDHSMTNELKKDLYLI